MNKNLWLLILSQIFAFTAAPVTVFLSGIIGSQISPLKSLSTLFMPTENIIRGILNNSTITLPIEKFVLFNKFIDAEIAVSYTHLTLPTILLV